VIILNILLAASAATAGHQPKCDVRVGELVPNAQVARELAEAIIRSRQTAEQRSRYVLNVEQEGATGWVVFQSLPETRPDRKGNITVSAGGGGLGLQIDRCNGAMTKVHYQR
jgi:hypothetical protein